MKHDTAMLSVFLLEGKKGREEKEEKTLSKSISALVKTLTKYMKNS